MSGPMADAAAYLVLPDGRRLPLDRDVFIMGRGTTNDLPLNDQQVSRRHAQLKRLPQGWVLLDLHSANGTWVNGYQVIAPHLLQDGDEITVGEQRLVYHADRTATPPPPRRRQAETMLGRSAFGAEPAKQPAPTSSDESPTGEHRLPG